MKKATLVVNYFVAIVLFALMFIQSTSFVQTTKYLLLLITAYSIFNITVGDNRKSGMHAFNYLFSAATVIFVLYSIWYSAGLFVNITLYFFVAAIIGLIISLAYREPKAKKKTFVPPKKPVKAKPVKKVAAKKTARKTTKRTTKKAVKKKKPSKKKPTKKKSTKKTTKKKVAKKKKPIKKKTAKKKATKKRATRGRPKVVKKTTTYYK